MGKVKQQLTEDMMLNPENYNNPEPTEEEYEDVQGLFDDFLDKHIVVARMPDADKDEIESIIIDNKKDTL
jgi:hypothetical protein